MDKKILFISCATIALLLSSCQKNHNSLPTYEDFTDTYVDKISEDAKDGPIFQAFCWSYNNIKEQLPTFAEMGFKTIQTSPVQQPKGGGGTWWSYYQPLSFSIADNSQLGSKQDLKDLCDEAEKYDIAIICDIVFNHLANISDSELETDGTPKVSPLVEAYEPEIYQNRNNDVSGIGVTFHHNPHASGSGAETQYYQYGALPDLNTGNAFVQSRCLSLLKECIDVGVDGFRFDAAKHIETPQDPNYASDFWPNTLGVAKQYYKDKTGKDLFAYGEILGAPIGRNIDVYTEYMSVTEGSYCGSIANAITKKAASDATYARFGQNTDLNNIVSWVESHDDYASTSGVDAGSPLPAKRIGRIYANLASRKGITPMFLGRPALNDENDPFNVSMGNIGPYDFESEAIGVINRFHNRFLNAEEDCHVENDTFVIERFSDNDAGAVINNYNLNNKKQEISFSNLENGNYYDTFSGNKVVVHNGKATVEFDSFGICVLTKKHTQARPSITFEERSGVYAGQKEINVSVEHANEAYYQINDGNKINFTDNVKINLPNIPGSYVNLSITLKNGDHTVIRSGSYQCVELIDGYFNVINFNPSHFLDYEVYMWHWDPGTWQQITSSSLSNNTLLIEVNTSWRGFLLALFKKGHVPTNSADFSSDAFVKQTSDINIGDGYYDASKF